jgi:hypothetical protein
LNNQIELISFGLAKFGWRYYSVKIYFHLPNYRFFNEVHQWTLVSIKGNMAFTNGLEILLVILFFCVSKILHCINISKRNILSQYCLFFKNNCQKIILSQFCKMSIPI